MNETNYDADFEQPVENVVSGDTPYLPTPERHGFVTAWLIFILIANIVVLLKYLYATKRPEDLPGISIATLYDLIILEILNIVLTVGLLLWKKNAFYGFFFTAAVSFLINISNSRSILVSLWGLLGILVLYGILQIKKNGMPAWKYLK